MYGLTVSVVSLTLQETLSSRRRTGTPRRWDGLYAAKINPTGTSAESRRRSARSMATGMSMSRSAGHRPADRKCLAVNRRVASRPHALVYAPHSFEWHSAVRFKTHDKEGLGESGFFFRIETIDAMKRLTVKTDHPVVNVVKSHRFLERAVAACQYMVIIIVD